MPQHLMELGGEITSTAVMHIAPANGFVPQTYLPLLRPFMDGYRVVCLPPRALWSDGGPPLTPDADWSVVADDLLAGLARFNLPPVVAIGHSFGGIASMLAAIEQPERFRALILLDPTILTPEICEMLRIARRENISIPVAEGALRRRREFASVQEAFDFFRSRSLFGPWPEETLMLYAEHGTRPAENGRRTLTWSAEWEAYYFNTSYAETWDIVPKLKNLRPTLIIRGGASDTFMAESAQKVAALLPAATHLTLPGHGHLFPQTAPEETARLIREWLAKL